MNKNEIEYIKKGIKQLVFAREFLEGLHSDLENKELFFEDCSRVEDDAENLVILLSEMENELEEEVLK